MASPSENAFALYRRLTDPLARLVIRIGYKILCIYWRQQKIKKIGVGVLIHHNGQVLTVRHSYRPEYTIPGGGIGKAETPAVAAARELCEELSLSGRSGGSGLCDADAEHPFNGAASDGTT